MWIKVEMRWTGWGIFQAMGESMEKPTCKKYCMSDR